MVITTSSRTFVDTVDSVKSTITMIAEGNDRLVSYHWQYNYSKAAESFDLDLLPTYAFKVHFVFDPSEKFDMPPIVWLGEPLTILVWEDEDAVVRLGYSSPVYFRERYSQSLRSYPDEDLDRVEAELQELAREATGAEVNATISIDSEFLDDLAVITVPSNMSVRETHDAIRYELLSMEEVTYVNPRRVLSSANDFDISVSLIFFGIPSLDTLLMRERRTAAVDLPLRIITYYCGGQTFVAYDDPSVITRRHNIVGQDHTVAKLSKLFGNLASIGVNGPPPTPTSPDEIPSSVTADAPSIAIS